MFVDTDINQRLLGQTFTVYYYYILFYRNFKLFLLTICAKISSFSWLKWLLYWFLIKSFKRIFEDNFARQERSRRNTGVFQGWWRSIAEIRPKRLKATPHKDRLTTLYRICLIFFRHTAQKSLDIRQYACKISVHSDEKIYCASSAQSLCGIALKKFTRILLT